MFAKTVTQVNLFRITCLILLLFPCASGQATDLECPEKWQPSSPRTISDDLFYTDLGPILENNIRALQRKKDTPIEVCGQTIATTTFIKGYTALKDYLPHRSPLEISDYINTHFSFCRPDKVLITGYYEPVVPASLSRTPQFSYPLYTTPDNENQRRASRKAIETTDILKDQELAYLADPFTAFTIHIQGSALLLLPDGTTRQVHYQADNGRPYTSVGRILIDQGQIKPEAMSMQAIKDYVLNHPDQAESLLHANKRFIYFSLTDSLHNPPFPTGSFNIPLTPERSIALDPKIYPQGLLFHLQGTLPVPSQTDPAIAVGFHRREFSRFMLNQDSGSAIKGATRVDLFMGRGQWAENMAGEMQERGCLRVLLPK